MVGKKWSRDVFITLTCNIDQFSPIALLHRKFITNAMKKCSFPQIDEYNQLSQVSVQHKYSLSHVFQLLDFDPTA
jgi:hypothetical protein